MSSTIAKGIGKVLRPFHAGDKHLVANEPESASLPETIGLTSTAFADGAAMPARHAAEGVGDNVSPPLAIENVPAEAVQLVLIVQDPDAPMPKPLVHLVAILPPDVTSIGEGQLEEGKGGAIRLGKGSMGKVGYAGPWPPPGHGPHRYVFQLFALNKRLPDDAEDLKSVMQAMKGAVLARGQIIGTFERT